MLAFSDYRFRLSGSIGNELVDINSQLFSHADSVGRIGTEEMADLA